eukprot:7025971-Pyramimonas_sp.AAC.1
MPEVSGVRGGAQAFWKFWLRRPSRITTSLSTEHSIGHSGIPCCVSGHGASRAFHPIRTSFCDAQVRSGLETKTGVIDW